MGLAHSRSSAALAITTSWPPALYSQSSGFPWALGPHPSDADLSPLDPAQPTTPRPSSLCLALGSRDGPTFSIRCSRRPRLLQAEVRGKRPADTDKNFLPDLTVTSLLGATAGRGLTLGFPLCPCRIHCENPKSV